MRERLISVIIPVYNVETYLERCLDSVINNTYKNLEIICINDGSPDNSQKILEHYAAKDSRIKVIVKENQGVFGARNSGIECASGDYLYFLDSDDWIHRQSFELLLCAAKECDADIIVGGRKEAYMDAVEEEDYYLAVHDNVSTYDAETAQKNGILRSFVTGRLYKKTYIGNLFFYNVLCGEDTAYNAMLMSNKQSSIIAYLNIPLYFYFQGNEGSIVKNGTLNTYLIQSKWYLENLDLFDKTDYAIYHAFRSAFLYRYIGAFSGNPDLVRRNSRKCLGVCKAELKNNRTISVKIRVSLLLLSVSNQLYRFVLIKRDSTYKDAERHMIQKYKSAIVTPWEEL